MAEADPTLNIPKKKREPIVLAQHITVLQDPLRYKCEICARTFQTRQQVKYHNYCREGDKPFKCTECDRTFVTRPHYQYHLRTHSGERPFKCPECGKGFNQACQLKRHSKSHLAVKPYHCAQCDRRYGTMQALQFHMFSHTGEKPYPCPQCSRSFRHPSNLRKHVKVHSGEKPFHCTQCDKKFRLKWTLKIHLQTHGKARPFQCDACSNSFSLLKDLHRHALIHTGDKPFHCSVCSKPFSRKDQLQRHTRSAHLNCDSTGDTGTSEGVSIKLNGTAVSKSASRSHAAATDHGLQVIAGEIAAEVPIRIESVYSLEEHPFNSNVSTREAVFQDPGLGAQQVPVTVNSDLLVLSTTPTGIRNSRQASDLHAQILRMLLTSAVAKLRPFCSPTLLASRFQDFKIVNSVPMAFGMKYAFYGALLGAQQCVLLLQGGLDRPRIEMFTSTGHQFTESVSAKFIPWSGGGDHEKVLVSVLPTCIIAPIPKFVETIAGVTETQKIFAILLTLDFWGRHEMSDLIVCCDVDDAELVFVTAGSASESIDGEGGYNSNKKSEISFQVCLKQMLLRCGLMSDRNEELLLKILCGKFGDVKAALKRFLLVRIVQIKVGQELFEQLLEAPSEERFDHLLELEKVKCIQGAVLRLLNSDTKSISPFRKVYYDFLSTAVADLPALFNMI